MPSFHQSLHPATGGNRCRDSQPNIRENLRILPKRGRKDYSSYRSQNCQGNHTKMHRIN
ncbi:hypothetical protein LEMLEM_LOCUS10053 [Lemmus lemmus]